MFWVWFERIEHAAFVVPVQVPSPPAFVRFNVYPLRISALLIKVVSFVNVGIMCRPSASTNALLFADVAQSNSPLPKPLI
jgi:hypothetical protein